MCKDYQTNGKCCERDYCACNFSFSYPLKLLVIVCEACLFTAVSSEVFDHCKLCILMTINLICSSWRSIIVSIYMYTILLSGVRNGSSAFRLG